MKGFFVASIAYFVGSIMSGILLPKWMGVGDPRSCGSGNPGATNVARSGHKKLGLLVLMCDWLKGFLVIMAAKMLGVDPLFYGLIALTVVIGHLYPIYFAFKGGKGVATGMGAIFAINPVLGLILTFIWGSTIAITHVSALGAIVAFSLAPFAAWLLSEHNSLAILMLSILVLIKHQTNIKRMIKGRELSL